MSKLQDKLKKQQDHTNWCMEVMAIHSNSSFAYSVAAAMDSMAKEVKIYNQILEEKIEKLVAKP